MLNELDHWIESQWQSNPVTRKYSIAKNPSGSERLSNAYRAMKGTRLKEMFIVRYADDFRIFCRTKVDAELTKIAVTEWLRERLKLDISIEKTKVVNVKRKYSEFIGFKIKVFPRRNKLVVKSHISDKQLKQKREKLTEQAKNIAKPRQGKTELEEIKLYNSMVMGMQNYYCIATNVSKDCRSLNRSVMIIFKSRLGEGKKTSKLRKKGRKLTPNELGKYGNSRMLRYVAGTDEPIYPIGYVQHKNPIPKKRKVCCYTAEGRKDIHTNLKINLPLMLTLMRQPLHNRSAEYADNRISLFSAQWGKCAVTGMDFLTTDDIHCHHITPRSKGGTDEYGNLILVLEPIHRLIHAVKKEIVEFYLNLLNLNDKQLEKLNTLREKAGMPKIA